MQQNNFILIFISAFITGISQHLGSLGFIAWLSLTPLFIVLLKISDFRYILIYSFYWGFIYNLVSVYWIAQNIGTNIYIAIVSMILTVLILSFNTVFIAIIWYRVKYVIRKSLYLIPFIWVSVEYIRSYGVLGFPWINLANTQTKYFYLIQNSEYVGIYGISFWVVLLNVIIYYLYQQCTKYNLYIFFVCLLSPFISGIFIYQKLHEHEVNDFKVSLIQPNINLFDKRNINNANNHLINLVNKSKECINNGSDLIIWPESALPFHNIQFLPTLNFFKNNLLIDNQVHILTGNVIHEDENTYNSAVLINKDGIKNYYHKQQLVPMGEYVPLSNKIDLLKNINLGQANFSKGNNDVLFEVNEKYFSSMICFESTFPEINRRHVKKGAEFLVYLVNDGWYTKIAEPKQHTKQSIFRAIENRKTVLRCANTGLSVVIDPSGHIREMTDLNTESVITTFIKNTNYITFYTLYGNVFAYLMLTITCIMFLLSIYKNEKNK